MRYAVLALIVAAACGPKNYTYPYEKEPDPRKQELLLGVGDVLSINVWDQKDLNTEATIRPDGTITMPLVGDLKASGQTTMALREQIKGSLANYVKLAGGNEITVSLKEWKNYRFTVQGEVSRPGVYTNDKYITVSDALALAGGPTRFAKRNSILLMRADSQGTRRSIPLDFDLLASGKRPDMNVWILSDDVIYVP